MVISTRPDERLHKSRLVIVPQLCQRRRFPGQADQRSKTTSYRHSDAICTFVTIQNCIHSLRISYFIYFHHHITCCTTLKRNFTNIITDFYLVLFSPPRGRCNTSWLLLIAILTPCLSCKNSPGPGS